MKTQELIDMLASGDVRPAPLPARRIVLFLALGVMTSVALMATFLGVRPHLAQVLMLPAFWMKFIFVLALAGAGWRATARLSSPGASMKMVPVLIASPLVIIWLIAAVSLITVAPEERGELFWGDTWRVCDLLIAGLSLPVLVAILAVMREFAPTRLRLAGAAAGLTAGAIAASVYCLHCPEMAAPFVGFWYVLGILIPTAIGALVGPRVLHW
jgi:hypothetical protein